MTASLVRTGDPSALVSASVQAVASEGAASLAAAQSRDGGPRIWTVQVGSFANPDSAQQLKAKLIQEGFLAQVSASYVTGQMLYRVRTLPATDRVSAEALSQRLQALGHDVDLEAR